MESGWGIPNIKDILERLGEQKPGFFCKLDLTAGFHQMLISEESRKFTAFKTSWGGLYEWCRLPMGLKGSPAYFQQIMATEVLTANASGGEEKQPDLVQQNNGADKQRRRRCDEMNNYCW